MKRLNPKSLFMPHLSAPSFKTLTRIKQTLWRSAGEDLILGEFLTKKNIVTDSQVQTALGVQKEKLDRLGRAVPLGQIIVELGYASEAELVQAINDHYSLSITSLSDNIKELVGKKRGNFIDRLPAAPIPIWLQLSGVTIFITVLTIVILNYLILNRQKEQLYATTVKAGRVSLNYLTNDARIPLLKDDILRLNTVIKNVTADEGLLYGIIVNQDGVIKAHTDYKKIGKPFAESEQLHKENRNGKVIYLNYSYPGGKKALNLTQPILFKGKRLGEAHVGVSIDLIDELIRRDRASILSITLFIVLFGVLIAVLLGFHFSFPISKLVRATQEIGQGNYHHKVVLDRNDELGNLATAFNQMSRDLWKKSLMQESFGKYVGSEVLEMILANPETTWLKGRRNEATTLFADIRGFTAYSDARQPEAVVEALNEYFEIATRIILQEGGYIDKFIGDAVLGVFGVPVFWENHTERAVRAAIALQKALQQQRHEGNSLLAAVGISIDSGVIVSGNIGSPVKMEYTVIGDSVNAASRLNAFAGAGEIIISKTVNEKISGTIDTEALAPQAIKGKKEPVEIFKILAVEENI